MGNVLQGRSARGNAQCSGMTMGSRYDTPEIRELFETLHLEVQLYELGAHPPVDLIPLLKYIPKRFAPWKRICREIKQKQRSLHHALLRECEERVAEGQDADDAPFMDQIVQRQDELGLSRDMTACVILLPSAIMVVLMALPLPMQRTRGLFA
jgi:hypothetical protein